MYSDEKIRASLGKVEAAREQNIRLNPPRMTAEEKDALLKAYHPDYREEKFAVLDFGPNAGDKVPTELKDLLQGKSRILGETLPLENPDYDADVLVIGGGGAGASAAIEASNAGAKVVLVTKLRLGDANTMMAEGGIQAATILPPSTFWMPTAAATLRPRRTYCTSWSPRLLRPSAGCRSWAWSLTRRRTAP